MKQSILLSFTSSDHGHQGSREVHRSRRLEFTDGEKDISLVEEYKKITFKDERILDQSEERITVSLEDLVAFIEQHGTRS